jgi:hypothetical protein
MCPMCLVFQKKMTYLLFTRYYKVLERTSFNIYTSKLWENKY